MSHPPSFPAPADPSAREGCGVQASGSIELYFYDELTAVERGEVEQHLRGCAECRQTLGELRLIREALAGRPAVEAPPGGDWTGFMTRLERAVEPLRGAGIKPDRPVGPSPPTRRGLTTYLAAAAVFTLVTAGVLSVARHQAAPAGGAGVRVGQELARAPDTSAHQAVAGRASRSGDDSGFAAVSGQHFERSKLVILGLSNKDAQTASTADWAYERQLASSLLDDTRLYKQTAAERGLGSLAGVMSDLELVLLQASLSDQQDTATLDRLQRLIRRRDLVTKMEVFEGSNGF